MYWLKACKQRRYFLAKRSIACAKFWFFSSVPVLWLFSTILLVLFLVVLALAELAGSLVIHYWRSLRCQRPTRSAPHSPNSWPPLPIPLSAFKPTLALTSPPPLTLFAKLMPGMLELQWSSVPTWIPCPKVRFVYIPSHSVT